MLFLRSPLNWWFGIYKTKSMTKVDYQMNLEAWLQNASLFRNEPVDYDINFEDLLSNEKANSEEVQNVLGLSDLGWLDEKVNLAIYDNPNCLLDHRNDTEPLMDDDDAAFLLGFMDGTLDPSYLPSDAFKITDLDLNNCLNSQTFVEPASSENLDTHLASPGCTTLVVDSPAFQSPASPSYSDISDKTSSNCIQQSSDITSDLGSNTLDSIPEIHVSVCESSASPSSSSDEVLSIEDISACVRKRKFVSNGKNIPKVTVVLKDFSEGHHGAAKASRSVKKPKDRRERKKVQNKEAAARYRIKRRVEEKVLSDEVSGLEATQKKLQDKHDALQSEIKYLKSLMCEILQKKGIVK